MMKAIFLLYLMIGSAVSAFPHELITTRIFWTQHISRIFYRSCISCHRAEGSSFPLTRYREVRPWAKAIKNEVLNRRMPPWNAVKGFGQFKNDISLSEREIALISSWVEGGAPEGHRIYLPPMPTGESLADEPEPDTEPFRIQEGVVLTEPLTAIGVRPGKLAVGASLEVVAYGPDGSRRYLIWLRDYAPEWERSYYFRQPVVFPAGTRLSVFPTNGASASLLIAAPSQAR